MGAAAIVGIGGGDQAGPVFTFVHHQGLAVIGLEVQQRQVAAQGDLSRPHGIGQPALVRVVAQPLTAHPPQAGPAGVGIAQCRQRRGDDGDAGFLQARKVLAVEPAIKRIDGVGDDHDWHGRVAGPSGQQGVGELAGQGPAALVGSALKIVEQEHVDHDEFFRLAN